MSEDAPQREICGIILRNLRSAHKEITGYTGKKGLDFPQTSLLQ